MVFFFFLVASVNYLFLVLPYCRSSRKSSHYILREAMFDYDNVVYMFEESSVNDEVALAGKQNCFRTFESAVSMAVKLT